MRRPTARVYLGCSIAACRPSSSALRDGFGVEPARVVQNAYEPIQFDETGTPVRRHADARHGRASQAHAEPPAGRRDRRFSARFPDAAGMHEQRQPPRGLPDGSRHRRRHRLPAGDRAHTEIRQARHLRARSGAGAGRRHHDGDAAQVAGTDEFKPYSPAAALPYAHHWRLFRTPNDGFLTANTHREGISPFDILQPSYAGLYSGAVHPSAEAHAIVADHVLLHVRAILDRQTK